MPLTFSPHHTPLLTPRVEENTHTVTFETGKFCDQIGADRKRVVPLMVGRDVLTRGGCFSFRKVEENLSTFACTFESCDPEGLAADLAKRLSRRALDSSLADLSGIGFGSIFGGGGARSARKRAERQLSKGELKEMGNASESSLRTCVGGGQQRKLTYTPVHAKKEYSKAIEVYTMALTRGTTTGLAEDAELDSVILSNRSACYLTLGKAEDALQDAKRATQVRPDWPKAHWRVGRAFEVMGDVDAAAKAYGRGMEVAEGDEKRNEFAAAKQRCAERARRK